jgi:hypothetical protein
MREEETAEIIRASHGIVVWEDLRIHAERDGLILVSVPLDVMDVAMAFAEDKAVDVEAWLASGAIGKPDATVVDLVKQTPDMPFQMVICQPWVIAQILPT